MIDPISKDVFLSQDGRLSRTWDVWFNNLINIVNQGDPPSSDTEVSASGGIKLVSHTMRIKSDTGNPIVLTANPQMSPGYDNQEVKIEGLSDTATVQIINGNGFALNGGANFTVKNNSVLIVHFNKSKNLWIENSRSN